MIEFNCEHCGKELHLADNYAGRDGWCRVCKRMVIVPANGKIQHVDELPMAEGYERLQRLLQYAASKADKFKVHLAQQNQSDRRVETLEAELHEAQERLDEKEHVLNLAYEAQSALEQAHARKLDEAMAMVASLETALATSDPKADKRRDEEILELGKALRAAQDESNTLQSQLNEQAQEVADLQAALSAQDSDSNGALETLSSEHDILQHALKEKDTALETATAEVQRLTERLAKQTSPEDSARADQEEIARLHAELSDLKNTLRDVEADRDTHVAESAAHRAEIQEHQENSARLEAALKTQNEALGSLQARHEDRERTTREQIFALEEQLGLFDELTARVSSLQGKVSTLDQERIDLTLRLEEAQRQQAVDAKKHESLEQRLQEATAEKAAHLVQLEDYQREGSCHEAQLSQLKDELRVLTESQHAATLEREKETHTLQQKESEITALQGDLDGANARLAEQQTAYEQLEQRLTEQQSTSSQLEQELANAASEHARLVAQLDTSTQTDSETAQALQETRSRIEALEADVREHQNQAENHRAEADRLQRSLTEAETQIQELEAEISELEDYDSPPPPPKGPQKKPDTTNETAETLFVVDPVSEVKRQQERKQMMDVLSDFLDK